MSVELTNKQQAPASGTVKEEEPGAFVACLNKIPICGGFCAPTKSTEQSCLRHFSNETTPPQPCLGRYSCRMFWEHNWCCRLHGKLGCGFGDKYRHYIMLSAFVVSFTAWILQFAALAALSTHTQPVENVYWAKSFVTINSTQFPPYGKNVTSYMGIHRRIDVTKVYTSASLTTTTETTENKDWDDASTCTLEGYTTELPGCSTCGDTAKGLEMLLISSAITQIFQMTTDLQRTTRWGDLHCQKSLGTITGIYGFVSTLQSISGFMNDCTLADFGDWFNTRNELTQSGEVVEFSSGPGLALLFTATVFKLYDVLCHMLVPVAQKQNEYEADKDCCDEDVPTLEEYMGRNTSNTSWNEPLGATTDAAANQI
jgi:hypothetical protein